MHIQKERISDLAASALRTQIISSEVFSKVDQTKFVGVASELNADGKPFTPTYYKSRIHIDLSSDEIYASNFEQLLRWIFDKPLYVKPTLGQTPDFLDDKAIKLSTGSRARRAKDQIQAGSPSAPAALEDYLITLSAEFAKLRVTSEPHEAFDDEIVESIEQELPYRNEYVEVITLAARYWNADYVQKLHKFFEMVALYLFRPANMTSYNNWSFDNFYFIINELFLYTISILLRAGRLREAGELLAQQYYVIDHDNRAGPMWNFTIFNHHASSLDHRSKRLKLNRLSLQADFLEKALAQFEYSFCGSDAGRFCLVPTRRLFSRKGANMARLVAV